MNTIGQKPTFIEVLASFLLTRLLSMVIVVLLCIALLFNNVVLDWGRHVNIFYFYLLVGSSVVICCLIALSSNYVTLNKIDVAFIILAVYLIARECYTQGEIGYSDRHLTYSALGCLYFVLKATIERVGSRTFVRTITLLALGSAIYGLLQCASIVDSNNPHFKITGFFSNPGPFAAYLTITLPFVILTGVTESKLFRTIAPWVLAICIAAIIFSCSRASLLATFVAVGLGIRYLNKDLLQRIFRWSNRWVMFAFVAFLVVFLSFLFYEKSNSTLGRLLVWDVSTDMLKMNWLFGIGLGQFEIQYPIHQATYFSRSASAEFAKVAGMTYYAFNDWLQVAIECGVCGLTLFMLLFYSACTCRAKEPSARAAKACIVTTTLVLALFFYPMSVLPIQAILVFSLALLSSASNDHFSFRVISSRLAITKAVYVALIIVCVFALRHMIGRYNSIQAWKAAYTAHLFDRKQGLVLYRELLPQLKENGEFLFNYGALLVEGGKPAEGELILSMAKHQFTHIDLYLYLGNAYKAMGKFKEADRSYEFASQMIPSRFYPKYLQAILYQEMGDTIGMQAKAREIVNMDVKVLSPTVHTIREEMAKLLSR